MSHICAGTKFVSTSRIQWAPTLTSHDPNPPITIETAGGGGVVEADGSSIGVAASAIVGAALWVVVVAASALAGDSVAGAILLPTVGASAGIATGTGVGEDANYGADGAATGTATVSGQAVAVWNGDASAAGAATDNAVGGATAGADGVSPGTAAVSGTSGATAGSNMASIGAASAGFLGARVIPGVGESAAAGGNPITLYHGLRIYMGGTTREILVTGPGDIDASGATVQTPSGTRAIVVGNP